MPRIEGAERLVLQLKQGEGLIPAIERIAVKVTTEAKRLCPVGTPESTGKRGYVGGRLRASLGFQVLRDERGPVGRVGSGQGPGTEEVAYAAYVEYGTSVMEPRPHLRPALTSVLGQLGGAGE